MNLLTNLLPLLFWLIVIALLTGVFRIVVDLVRSGARGPLDYRKKASLLTPAELRFLETLRAVVPRGVTVAVKVRMADLVESERGHNWRTALNKVQSKHADFTLCDQVTYAIFAVIELDDASHNRDERVGRDAFFDEALTRAGISVIRVKVQKRYDEAKLREAVARCLPRAGTVGLALTEVPSVLRA